ncbi:hypothetical protein BHM03_00050835 [Ensete ventricosum]|nr:hypothetical protein BHM03_00050835 [Ensete ventricosum]
MCVSLSVSVGHGSTNSARDCTSGSSSSGLYLGLLLLWSMPLAPPPWVCASCSFSSSPFAGVMHKSTVGVGVFDVTPSTIKYLTDCTLDLTSVDVLGKADAYDRCGAKVWRGASYLRALGAEENDGSSAIRRHCKVEQHSNKSMGCPSRLST